MCLHLYLKIATTEPIHSHVSCDNDDDLPPPIMLPKAYHPPNTVSHLPQSSRPISYPVEASQYHNAETEVITSLMEIPFDPNLVCPICRRMFRKGEIQLYKQHVEMCQDSVHWFVKYLFFAMNVVCIVNLLNLPTEQLIHFKRMHVPMIGVPCCLLA